MTPFSFHANEWLSPHSTLFRYSLIPLTIPVASEFSSSPVPSLSFFPTLNITPLGSLERKRAWWSPSATSTKRVTGFSTHLRHPYFLQYALFFLHGSSWVLFCACYRVSLLSLLLAPTSCPHPPHHTLQSLCNYHLTESLEESWLQNIFSWVLLS